MNRIAVVLVLLSAAVSFHAQALEEIPSFFSGGQLQAHILTLPYDEVTLSSARYMNLSSYKGPKPEGASAMVRIEGALAARLFDSGLTFCWNYGQCRTNIVDWFDAPGLSCTKAWYKRTNCWFFVLADGVSTTSLSGNHPNVR